MSGMPWPQDLPGATPSLTDRQRREAEYYNRYSAMHPVERVDFAPVDAVERRPWSPYWSLCDFVRDAYEDAIKSRQTCDELELEWWQNDTVVEEENRPRLLDIGCGSGVTSVSFAHMGFRVEGIDISQNNIASSDRLARRYDLAERCNFQTMPAEKLAFEDQSFDVIVGVDVLHHVDIARAVPEFHRVLRPGGVAVFKEPFEAPLLEAIRDSLPVRMLAPRGKSFEKHVHITDDERKLTTADAARLGEWFDAAACRHFSLFNRFSRFFPKRYAALMRLDYTLFRWLPPLRKLGDVRVMTWRKSV